MGYVKDPTKTLRPLVKVLDEVCASTRRIIAEEGPVAVGYASFDRAILIRGLNILEAVRVLSSGLHWEAASSSARQMFELTLNMEALAAIPNREEGSLRFGLYALLQKARMKLVEFDYNRSVGRSVDETKAAETKAFLDNPSLDVFKQRVKSDGTVIWAKSWTGKQPWDLAKDSPNPNRTDQYSQLFVAWSDETHAAPVALMGAMMRTGGPDWADEHLNNELREMTQILLMVIHQYLELWTLLVNVPDPDRAAWQGWFKRINAHTFDRWGVGSDVIAAYEPRSAT
jgi:hypothetical protein